MSICILIVSGIVALIPSCHYTTNAKQWAHSFQNEQVKPEVNRDSLKAKAVLALQFCQKNNYHTRFCILADMKVHSGIKRLFVWDFQKDTIQYSCLVGHGCGDHPWSLDRSKTNPKFSNTHGSHLSSLGKYKIGQRGSSEWGVKTKYTLHGLDSTNSNAAPRFIVFHSWEMVPDEEIYPSGCAEGWGCPTISNQSFEYIDSLLKSSKKPVLLWMYI